MFSLSDLVKIFCEVEIKKSCHRESFYFSFEWYVTEYLACRKNVFPILCKEEWVLLHPCVVIAQPEMESNSCTSFNSSVCHH